MQVKEIMTRKVITLKQQDTLKTALSMFKKKKISGFPVINNNRKVIGVVSETDILRIIDVHSRIFKADSSVMLPMVLGIIHNGKHFEQVREHVKKIMNLRVSQFMKKKPITLDEKDDIYKASSIMTKKDINRIPVTKKGRLVGIVTRSDVVNVLVGKRLAQTKK